MRIFVNSWFHVKHSKGIRGSIESTYRESNEGENLFEFLSNKMKNAISLFSVK